MEDKVAIRVNDLDKSFRLPHEKSNSIKGSIIGLVNKNRTFEIQEALKGINFEVKQGEFFGIVGRNGSGKSTLLKLLAGIYSPTKGSIEINGSLTPFIELGVGFNPELTGRANVFLNGALLGFNRKQMQAMYKDITEFAELENFMDQKLKNYSSGMQVRLAFSIAIRAKTDILLIDEVLAVGDSAFQEKCYNVFEKLKAQKKTIVFVSHDMGVIERFCTRAILVNNGVLIKNDTPKVIAKMYEDINERIVDEDTKKDNRKKDLDTQLKIKLAGGKTNGTTSFSYGDTLKVHLSWAEDLKVKNVGVAIYKQTGEYIFGGNTIYDKYKLKGNSINYDVELKFGSGKYIIVAAILGDKSDDILEIVGEGPRFSISEKSIDNWEGLFLLKHSWSA